MKDLSPDQNHVFELVKLISASYLKICLHHLAKEKNNIADALYCSSLSRKTTLLIYFILVMLALLGIQSFKNKENRDGFFKNKFK